MHIESNNASNYKKNITANVNLRQFLVSVVCHETETEGLLAHRDLCLQSRNEIRRLFFLSHDFSLFVTETLKKKATLGYLAVNACADPCKTLSPKTVGKPLATEVPAAMADQTRHEATVAVLRLTTSTALPAMRLQVLNRIVKLKDASSPKKTKKKHQVSFFVFVLPGICKYHGIPCGVEKKS